MTAQEMILLMEKAKELGVREFSSGDLKIKFRKGQAPATVVTDVKTSSVKEMTEKELTQVFTPQSPLDDLSPEEILYYATPYFDELQAKKAQHQKKLDEEQKEENEEKAS